MDNGVTRGASGGATRRKILWTMGSAALAQVRHGTVDFSDFEAVQRHKFRVCSGSFWKLRCSVDLPSCPGNRPMTRSSQNVFAPESSEQGRQGAHLLVAGGIGAHTQWAAAEDAVSSW